MNDKAVYTIIVATLAKMGGNFDSKQARELLLGTCAVESAMGKYRKQIGGPALGIMQMEPATFNSIMNDYVKYRPGLKEILLGFSKKLEPQELENNDELAIAMARIRYYWSPDPIPLDLKGQARFWKDIYNTHLGKGTVQKYLDAWNKYCTNYIFTV